MLFYLHYCLMTSGLSGTSVLLAVFFKTYTDASQSEIGALLMSFPFVSLIIKPLFCSMADRHQAHRLYLLLALIVEMLGYLPFAVLPFYPAFYSQYPRAAWYILVAASHVGGGGLGVAWSLGDCLAVNYSQKTGTPFGRMRLMGTLSWGVYGFIIGQINEWPGLPKYLPAFIILHLSLVLELAMVFLWNREDFVMVDPLAGLQSQDSMGVESGDTGTTSEHHQQPIHAAKDNFVDSLPSSLGGTLRINPKTASAFRDVLAAADEADELHRRLGQLEHAQQQEQVAAQSHQKQSLKFDVKPRKEQEKEEDATEPRTSKSGKSPQLILLKMILLEDGRVIKYALLFTIFGLLMAPMNFIFLSMEEVSRERGYNFSQLAGAVLISQALIETVAFFVTPWCMNYVTKWVALSVGLVIMSAKYFFYAGWYYNEDMSPYWAVLAEWSHGISYGIFCTIQAEVALMFANQSRLFIGELRKMGYMSPVVATVTDDRTAASAADARAKIEAEETAIKMALRATMSSLFSGLMDGLGQGSGALICGIFIEMYSYIRVWQIMAAIASAGIVAHLLVELSRSRWSDRYKAQPGTKAFEIMQLSKAAEERQRLTAGARTRHTVVTLAAASMDEKPPKESASPY